MARADDGAPNDDRLIYGRRPVVELLRSGGAVERILVARESTRDSSIAEIRRRADSAGIPLRLVPRVELDNVSGGGNHQGVVAHTARYRYADLNDLFGPQALVVFLDGVTDPHNLGSIIRSADGAGFTGVVVPARRAAGVTSTVRRVSAGASEVVPVARVTNLGRALDDARTAGLWIVGLDEAAGEDLWASNLLEAPLGLVLGAEDRGLSRHVRERCDAVVSIPSAGRLASLNVAVAGAIAMFEVARRRTGSAKVSPTFGE